MTTTHDDEHQVTWEQIRIPTWQVSKELTKLNLHPGYFHLLDDDGMTVLVYLALKSQQKGQR